MHPEVIGEEHWCDGRTHCDELTWAYSKLRKPLIVALICDAV